MKRWEEDLPAPLRGTDFYESIVDTGRARRKRRASRRRAIVTAAAACLLIAGVVIPALSRHRSPQDVSAGVSSSAPASPGGVEVPGLDLQQRGWIAPDAEGGLYFTDASVPTVRHLDAHGLLTTVLDTTRSESPQGLAVDHAGNLYFVKYQGNQIVRVERSGDLTVVAGTGLNGHDGDGGLATEAQLDAPVSIAFDGSDNLYIFELGPADPSGPSVFPSSRLRRVDRAGTITTIAGSDGHPPYTGDGGPALAASLGTGFAIAADHSGDVFILDARFQIRRVGADGTIATTAELAHVSDYLSFPISIAVDSGGSLYFAEGDYNRVRRMNPAGEISTVAGTGVQGSSGDSGLATRAALSGPMCVATDTNDNVYFIDLWNNRVRRIDRDGTIRTIVFGPSIGPRPPVGPRPEPAASTMTS